MHRNRLARAFRNSVLFVCPLFGATPTLDFRRDPCINLQVSPSASVPESPSAPAAVSPPASPWGHPGDSPLRRRPSRRNLGRCSSEDYEEALAISRALAVEAAPEAVAELLLAEVGRMRGQAVAAEEAVAAVETARV